MNNKKFQETIDRLALGEEVDVLSILDYTKDSIYEHNQFLFALIRGYGRISKKYEIAKAMNDRLRRKLEDEESKKC